ncbi:MAG: 30S ribosomal protein S9 [Bacteroidetes bacterium]|jgi:small subunit ribosomal protein S9|nr:30S ribosomal protein S9 [Bacteroidota bacterium]MBT5528968.1 30S ribosomal protein S9 [Cytophagia bacterium]MBT3421925.1 30S ribosomal protein S9 [Bacteroidota bacterium]MBT3799981.1 30S ribosomal protein S9 [Bacteroidota bacterium]MBT3933496.1 30S ribosomal protein S9 [Bacteroidota bacterium]
MENIHTVGRRKTSVARIFMSKGEGTIMVNNKNYIEYFNNITTRTIVEEAFKLSETTGTYNVKVNVQGGGTTGQAEATRLAIARALVEINEEFKDVLKKNGCLKRDPRMVERKKPGQPKARKKFQFRKR